MTMNFTAENEENACRECSMSPCSLRAFSLNSLRLKRDPAAGGILIRIIRVIRVIRDI